MNNKKHWMFFGVGFLCVALLTSTVLIVNALKKTQSVSIVYLPKIIDEDNDFWTSLLEGTKTAAQEYGVDLTVKAPEKETDYEEQNELIREILEESEKPDALLISPSSYTEQTQLLKKIKKQGIHLVMVDSSVDEKIADLQVSTDNVEAGRKLGDYAAQIMRPGEKVAVVGHVAGSSTNMEREKGFMKGLGSRKDDFLEVVYCESDYKKAYDLTVELITKYQDLGVIAGLNEYSAIGAARAVKDLGVEDRISLVGIDSSQEGISLMEQGIFKGIVIQKPFKMGYLGVKYTYEMLSGKTLPRQINSGSELVTLDNMYTRENEKLLFPFNEK